MAISRITGQDATGASFSSTLTVNWPGATTAGDLLIAVVASQGSPVVTGYTLVTSGTENTANTLAVYYKLATGSETSVSVTGGSAITNLSICEYTGNANPIMLDGTASAHSSGTTGETSWATSSITTTCASDLIFSAALINGSPTGFSWATSTSILTNTAAFHTFCGQHIVSTPQSGFTDTASWTSSNQVVTIIAAFKAAPVPGIAGAIGWWDASTLGLSNGASVTSWPGNIGPAMTSANNSGSGPTPHTAPTFETNVQNSLPIVRFNGTTDYLSAGNVNSITNPAMVFIVAKTAENPFTDYRGAFTSDTNGVGGDFVFIGSSGAADWYPAQADQVYYLNGSNVTTPFAAPALNTFAYMSMQSATYSGTFYPMVGLTEFGSTRIWLGDIAEIIVYNTQLSSTNRMAVETYLNNKWFGSGPPPTVTSGFFQLM